MTDQPTTPFGFDGTIPGCPSAVDRMAALAEPNGEAAARVKQWEENMAAISDLIAVSEVIYKRTVRDR